MALGPGTSELTATMVDPPRMAARWQTVVAQFERRAARFAQHDFIVREIERRLLDRLEVIRLDPAVIVDVGCGQCASRAALSVRYPRALWLGCDASPAMLRMGEEPAAGWSRLASLWRGPRVSAARRVVALADALPLGDDSTQLLWSNLMLHWHPLPHSVFPEWLRVLSTGGLLMFSCFGPDTLREVREAFAEAGVAARPMPFVDMHDFGDMMAAAGFATPVMDVEKIVLTYASPAALLAEVRALGGNPRDDRSKIWFSGARARAVLDALAKKRDADGRVALTFEIAYGHAWKAERRRPGVSAVSLDQLRDQLRRRG
jgi:malonyl-CoA O-methyltransferase